jgi:hypothetical protein
MKQYPSIEYWNHGVFGETCYAFDKLDGSNLRFEFSKKRGWYKFGTRNCMIDENNEQFGAGVKLFLKKYGDNLENLFTKHKDFRNILSIVVFAEYFGPNSFAGWHDPEDLKNDKMDIVLFDVNLYKKGFMPPNDFIKNFQEYGIPEVVYYGNYNQQFVLDVKENKFNLKEGVVVKQERKNQIWMCKIKTNQWLDKVKNRFGNEIPNELKGDFSNSSLSRPGI